MLGGDRQVGYLARSSSVGVPFPVSKNATEMLFLSFHLVDVISSGSGKVPLLA